MSQSDYGKISLRSPNFQSELARQLADLAPQIISDGKLDVEKLQELLGEDSIGGGYEKFGLSWLGKRQAQRTAQLPTCATLHPQYDLSQDWENTHNVFIEGENLEVLKALQTSYHGKIKMIYIDPPYNTGNDFVYNDSFHQNQNNYTVATGQRFEDESKKVDGNEYRKNTNTAGAFHSNWLNMMYPRLVLARQLLADDGVMVMSIDDDEMPRLRMLGDLVFGPQNFYASIVWQKKYSPANDAKRFSDMHDYLVVYARSEQFVRGLFPRTEENNKPYKYDDDDGRGAYRTDNLSVRTYSAANDYPVTNPVTGQEYNPPAGACWRYSNDKFKILQKENRIYWGKDGTGAPQLKRYLSDVQQGTVPTTWWSHEFAGHNDEARKEIRELFGTTAVFDTPKPTRVIKRLLQICTEKNNGDIVLDFFAGSGTTAHAVMAQNAEDGGNRQVISVQIAEPIKQKKGAPDLDYETVADVTRERIRRASTGIWKSHAGQLAQRSHPLDTGFRSFRLGESNFKEWKLDSSVSEAELERLFDTLEDSLKEDSKPYSVLFELLLKAGLPLDVGLHAFMVEGYYEFYTVDDRTLVYAQPGVTPGLGIWQKALDYFVGVYNQAPTNVYMLEDSLASEQDRAGADSLKFNLVQLAKKYGISRENVYFA